MADSRSQDGSRFVGFEAIPLEIHVRVGSTPVSLARLAEIAPGEVLPLDRRVGEPFELCAGAVLLGRVEPVAERDGVGVKLIAAGGEDDAAGR